MGLSAAMVITTCMFLASSAAQGSNRTTSNSVCQDGTEGPTRTLGDLLRKGPVVDLVFVLDRSESTQRLYNESVALMETLLRKYFVVHPDYTQVSVVTFAKTATVTLDHVHIPIVACDLFQHGVFTRLITETTLTSEKEGSMLARALDQAATILLNHKSRQHAKKVLWIFADGQENGDSENYQTGSLHIKTVGVEIFTVGQRLPNLGWMEYQDERNLKQLSTTEDHFGCISQWRDVVNAVPSPIRPSEYGDKALYEITCDRECVQNEACYCDAVTVTSSCTCRPGYYLRYEQCTACPNGTVKHLPGFGSCVEQHDDDEHGDDDYIEIFDLKVRTEIFAAVCAGIAVFIMIIVVICIVCCCAVRRCKGNELETDKEAEDGGDTDTIPGTGKKRRPAPAPPVPPSPPVDPPPDYQETIYGTVDLENPSLYKEKLHQDMPGWTDYMIDGMKAHCISGMMISNIDFQQWARTPGFMLKREELEGVLKALESVHGEQQRDYVNMELIIQGKKYALSENNGTLLQAHGPLRGRAANTLSAGLAGNFLVVAKAPSPNDRGQCKAEVLKLLRHLN